MYPPIIEPIEPAPITAIRIASSLLHGHVL
jgi:hypothetical protein